MKQIFSIRFLTLLLIEIISLLIFPGCSQEEPVEVNMNLNITVLDTDFLNEMQYVLSEEIIFENQTHTLKDFKIYDEVNNKDWRYHVILPNSYKEDKNYPILYLLHGMGSSADGWFHSINIVNTLNYYYSKGLPEIVVVLPDGDETYYLDDYQADIKYETFFKNVFMPEIEKKYHFSGNVADRFIGGFSMGGYAALYYSLKYLGEFSFCYAMSAPVDGKGDPRSPSVFKFLDANQIELIPSMHLDIGNRDSFLNVNIEAHLLLESLSIPHEFLLREGEHNSLFWKESLFILLDRLQKQIQ